MIMLLVIMLINWLFVGYTLILNAMHDIVDQRRRAFKFNSFILCTWLVGLIAIIIGLCR